MNELVQNILVFITLGIAVVFLIRKFVIPAKAKSSKSCGQDDCGCH